MKDKTVYVCSACGFESPKWLGKCPGCDSWSTLEEQVVKTEPKNKGMKESVKPKQSLQRLKEVEATSFSRYSSGSNELDRVLGGGIVPGSIVLCGGDPGIGKSTLLLQVCDHVARDKRVLYVSAEESSHQIKLRGDRLNCKGDNIFLLAETDIDEICAQLTDEKPDFAVVDSIQTVYAPYLSSAPGTVSQVRECASRLMRIAKEYGITVFTVGHVTKEGTLAGPKVLEHIVDTVMYFEGERNSAFRVLRANKNRFGSTNEIGVFEMEEKGMIDVKNPSEIFMSQRDEAVAGTSIMCSLEGTRPVMVEIQALTGNSGFNNPRRVGSGVDYSRMVTLLAVLEKRVGYSLYNQDVYVNVAGGLRIEEPALDLPVLAAVASAYKNVPLDRDTVLLGEVGLTGELRAINGVKQRIDECVKLGFKKIILPKGNKRSLNDEGKIK
ncbi:MAG: DNA repair protein RadA, partial [Clostridia bacterium]|nr:DNA repair protein RadA [Clostridia bacterium]